MQIRPLFSPSGRAARGNRMVVLAAGVLLALLAVAPLAAQPMSAPMVPAPPGLAERTAEPPPMRLAESHGVEPLARMSEAAVGARDEVEALAARNRAGRQPVQVGFDRPLPQPRTVRLDTAMGAVAAGRTGGGVFARATPSTTVWGASVQVENAYRLRLWLDDVALPAGTRMWVYSERGEAVGPFGSDLVHDGRLLTPSVAGPSIFLEVELPRSASAGAGEHGFRIDRVAEIVRLGPFGEPLLERVGALPAPVHDDCVVDASCVNSGTFEVVDPAMAAIAHLQYPEGGAVFICTGGLLNTVPPEGGGDAPNPPLLTANHCFSSQSSASGLEAFWDFVTPSCDGSPPDLGTLPRSNGSVLLATGPQSDFTLVGLSIPSQRVLLGWNANASATAPGTIVHRLSHPAPHGALYAQTYARYEVLGSADPRFQECEAGPGQDIQDPSKFLHLQPLEGGTFGGSSGAPSMLGNGQVVGQLFGGCPGADGCDPVNNDIDGSFQTTFESIQPYLFGSETPAPPSNTWLTTGQQPGFEFQVEITPSGGSPVLGSKEGDCIVESLCVSGALAGRPEVFVKLIGPRPNGFLWVQVSRFTPSQVEVWVRQTATGLVNYYQLMPVGAASDDVSGLQDREAFLPQ